MRILEVIRIVPTRIPEIAEKTGRSVESLMQLYFAAVVAHELQHVYLIDLDNEVDYNSL